MAVGALTGALLVLNVSLAAPLPAALTLVLTSGIAVSLLARGGAPGTRG